MSAKVIDLDEVRKKQDAANDALQSILDAMNFELYCAPDKTLWVHDKDGITGDMTLHLFLTVSAQMAGIKV